MVIRVHEQSRAIERVHDMMKSYDNVELIMSELASLGFFCASSSPDLYAVENGRLELYVRMRLHQDRSVAGYELLTFDELRMEMPENK